MKIADLIYITFQNFKNKKSRFFFTILGVAIAIAVVLSLVSFGYGLQKNLLEKITTEESMLSLDILPSDVEIISIDNLVLKNILSMENVEKVSPQANFIGQVSLNDINSEAEVKIINPDFFALDGSVPLVGEFFNDKDTKKIVVSSLFAQLFDVKNEEMVGKRIKLVFYMPIEKGSSEVEEIIVGSDFSIIGVVEGGGNTGEVYLNKNDFLSLDIKYYDIAKVKVKNEKATEEVRNNLINMGFIVSSISDIVSQANKIFGAIQVTLGVFGVFALIVAAIGLINTMTISLLERTNEIGIMRAIGASPKDIRKIFLVESTLIGFFGGLFGIIFGILGSEFLNWAFNLLAQSFGGVYTRLFSYPIWFIFFIMLVSTGVGFVGGFWPARRAEKMSPLSALRYK